MPKTPAQSGGEATHAGTEILSRARALHPPLAPMPTPQHPVGAASYTELALHHGHDVNVVIYGGDASATIECETCHTVLLAFEHTPTLDASLAALLALAQRHRLAADDLAGRVTDAAAESARAVNAQGVSAQLGYLVAMNGVPATSQIVQATIQARLA